MSQIVDPHVVEAGLLPDPLPVPGEAGEPAAGLRPPQHPGNPLGPLDAVEHVQHRPGQRHHARAGLRIAQAQDPRRAVHVVPFQGEDLVRPAAGEHQQADRGDRGRHHRAPGLEPLQRGPHPAELLRGQEALAGLRAVMADMPAWLAAGRHHPPALAQRKHLRQHPHRLIGRRRRGAKLVVERREVLGPDIRERLGPEAGRMWLRMVIR